MLVISNLITLSQSIIKIYLQNLSINYQSLIIMVPLKVSKVLWAINMKLMLKILNFWTILKYLKMLTFNRNYYSSKHSQLSINLWLIKVMIIISYHLWWDKEKGQLLRLHIYRKWIAFSKECNNNHNNKIHLVFNKQTHWKPKREKWLI